MPANDRVATVTEDDETGADEGTDTPASDSSDGGDGSTAADAESEASVGDDEQPGSGNGGSTDPDDVPTGSDDAGSSRGEASRGFLSNIRNARNQLGDAKDAFSNARGAGSLPTDEEGRVRLVCRRYEERRLAPLDDKGRPTCYEADHPDCEECVEAVREGSVGTW